MPHLISRAILLTATAATLLAANPGGAAAQSPSGDDAGVAVTSSGSQRVVTFDLDTPGRIETRRVVDGLASGERIVGMDYRPENRTVYAQGSRGQLYTLDPRTGAASPAGAPQDFGDGRFGTDFNPVADRLRSVSTRGRNLRTRVVDAQVTEDAALRYATGDSGAGVSPEVSSVAYSDNTVGASATTLYGLDTGRDVLVRQAPPNDGVLTTVGRLGVDATDEAGFDVSGTTGAAYALLTPSRWRPSRLYRIDLGTGAATPVGRVGIGRRFTAFTILPDDVRFATYNASLNRASAGGLIADLSTPDNAQARNSAEIVQRRRPDVLLLNEFDYDAEGVSAGLFQENYLSRGQNGAEPIEYPYRYSAPSNTGIPSGLDFNDNGTVGGPDDAFGFGFFGGQFGMQVYSKYPIEADDVRTFQTFRWIDMPDADLPDDPSTPANDDFYSPEEKAVFRLSSKSHWDLPIRIGGEVRHFLTSHPTPPVFDGPEDRNGARNRDEIRFWADYVSRDPRRSAYVYDDEGVTGGLDPDASFVIAGDQNSDPLDGDSIPGSIQFLLNHPRVDSRFVPSSSGGPQQALLQAGANAAQRSDPAVDTADFADGAPGNLRADYVLPSDGTRVLGGRVFWPLADDPEFSPVGVFTPSLPGGFPSSDHRMVFLDLARVGGER